jgi:leucyl/phenylalanyl-tRNA--protein transferase
MPSLTYSLPWLEAGQSFPPLDNTWPKDSDAPGLLAAGGCLNIETLKRAYSCGIFPWFGLEQPILWWSPDPRMVLNCKNFKLHRSLQKTLTRFKNQVTCEIRFDTSFERVIKACSTQPRAGQSGTWILPEMVDAYVNLHRAGYAHSVETWVNDELVGGLYCVALGAAVFGESMFTKISDGSKIALAALVAFCRENKIEQIDCQQNTGHLASLGGTVIDRSTFLVGLDLARQQPAPSWRFSPLYWDHILSSD